MTRVKNKSLLSYQIGFVLVMCGLFLLVRPFPVSRAADIDGTTGPDTMTGTVADDDIRGRSGVDIINGMEGNDEIIWRLRS